MTALLTALAARLVDHGEPAAPSRDNARSAGAVWGRRVNIDVEALYRKYGDLVLGRCRTLLRNEADAQEAAQEVFLRVHRYQDAFRGESSPSTWLFKVTTTTCLNRLRTRRRRPEDMMEEPPLGAVEDTVLTGTDLRDLVERVLELADETTRACVVYHVVDGMTHDEVGELVGLGGAAVRKRIATFRKRLQDDPPAWITELDA